MTLSDPTPRSWERGGALSLPDGRALAFYEWGPETGRPVLFCTGAGMSACLGFGAAELERLGARLIGVDRPGLGGSSPHEAKSLLTFADDIAHLAVERRLEDVRAVGFSQGAPFALALGARGVASAVAFVAGQDAFADPVVADALPPDLAGAVAQMQAEPGAMITQMAGGLSADAFFDRVLQGSAPVDRALYGAEPFVSAYRACLDAGFRKGGEGLARDLAATWRPWPFALEDVAVPVRLWYGALDASPYHSPDHGAVLERRLPNARRVLLEDEGGGLLWTRAAAIIEDLLNAS